MAIQTDGGKVLCEQCGNEYDTIYRHWALNESCEHPPLSSFDHEIITGLLMSDGYIKKQGKNPFLVVNMTSRLFIEWLSEKTGFKTNNRKGQTGEYISERLTNSGIDHNPENISDQYVFVYRSHPEIEKYVQWYGGNGNGEKEWPKEIELTPTVLLLLFVGDGHYSNNTSQRYIIITAKNEEGNNEKLQSYFEEKSLPIPRLKDDFVLEWTVEESFEIFKYMTKSPLYEDSIPGFEYKFPENFGGTGTDMSDLT